MADQLKGGEVVVLRSGGPRMTLSHYDADIQQYWCQWFEGVELKEGMFARNSLIAAPDDDPPGDAIVTG